MNPNMAAKFAEFEADGEENHTTFARRSHFFLPPRLGSA